MTFVAVFGLAAFVSAALAGLAVGSATDEATEPPAVLRVAKDGTGDYSSLSAAVDAAPAGATLHVAPGRYRTSVTIEKPLRIVGAGRHSTTLLPTAVWKGSTEELFTRAREAEAEGRRALERLTPIFKPLIAVQGAAGVALERLRITGVSVEDEGLAYPLALVAIHGSEVRMEDCAVLGAALDGIGLSGKSKLTLRDCFVAAANNIGLHVKRGEEPCEVAVSGSCFRSCTRAVYLSEGNSELLLENCAFVDPDLAGVWQHGGTLHVCDCAFLGGRQGVTSGRGEAVRVEGSLFRDCTPWALSCDETPAQVVACAFMGNPWGVTAEPDSTRWSVSESVFRGNEIAVVLSGPIELSEEERGPHYPALYGNVFWLNERHLAAVFSDNKAQQLEVLPLPDGNRVADPKLQPVGDLKTRLTRIEGGEELRYGVSPSAAATAVRPPPEEPEEAYMAARRAEETKCN